jgi:hypothetical protein
MPLPPPESRRVDEGKDAATPGRYASVGRQFNVEFDACHSVTGAPGTVSGAGPQDCNQSSAGTLSVVLWPRSFSTTSAERRSQVCSRHFCAVAFKSAAASSVELEPPIYAAGGVVRRSSVSGPEILLIHRPRYDDWSLPKRQTQDGRVMRDRGAAGGSRRDRISLDNHELRRTGHLPGQPRQLGVAPVQ